MREREREDKERVKIFFLCVVLLIKPFFFVSRVFSTFSSPFLHRPVLFSLQQHTRTQEEEEETEDKDKEKKKKKTRAQTREE